ncbi:MAG: hypothetical protein HRT89_09015 [Lentisphaeria bacterium]|nr:hypothetical protein [Lentisphaeria bacterium]
MRANMKRNPFNMIEIVVSLAVILVVLLAVVSLFTLGLTDNKEAMNRSSANDSMDQFIHMMSSRIEENWSNVDAFPETTPVVTTTAEGVEEEILWSDDSLTRLSSGSGSHYELNFQTSIVSQAFNTEIHNSGVFKIVHSSGTLGEDFSAEIRAWKTLTEYGSGDNRPKSIVLYAEISWPLTVAYESRRKANYQTVIYKPGLIASTEENVNEVACKTIWAIDKDGSNLYYYILSEGNTFTNIEGALDSPLTPSALTISSGGSIFFVSANTLYSIAVETLDYDSSTSVNPTTIGGTGLSGDDENTAMKFIGGVLYGLSKSSKKIYVIDSTTGAATFSSNMNVSDTFVVGAMTVSADGTVFVTNTDGSEGKLYSFESFPNGELTLAMTVGSSGALNALTAHPNGMLYAADSTKWYWIYPDTNTFGIEVNHSTTIQGFDFNFNYEVSNCSEDLSIESLCDADGTMGGSLSINPNNSASNEFTMTTANGTISSTDLTNSYSGFQGNATMIRITPFGNGNQNSLMVDGDVYPISNSSRYVLTGNMTVNLYKVAGVDGAADKWWIDITSTDASIVNCECTTSYDDDEESPCADDEDEVIEEVSTIFEIENGQIVLSEDANTTFRIVGGDMSYTGGQLNVTMQLGINDASYEPFGPFNSAVTGNILDNNEHEYDAGILEAGSEISITARSWMVRRGYSGSRNWHWNSWMARSSAPSNTNVYVLRDGDPVPNITAFGDQQSIAGYVASFVDAETGLISLADNQSILLYELYTTNMGSSAADFQDVVVVVTMDTGSGE